MTEEFLQYVWKHVLFDRSAIATTDGKACRNSTFRFT